MLMPKKLIGVLAPSDSSTAVTTIMRRGAMMIATAATMTATTAMTTVTVTMMIVTIGMMIMAISVTTG